MTDDKVFISYSRENTRYLGELQRVLATVPCIDKVLWFDERELGIGDQFHPAILQAMTEARLAILLLSTDFFGSKYITCHELPFLLRQAVQGALKLACVYVTRIPDDTLQRTITIDGQPRTVSLTDYLGVNSPAKPLHGLWRKSQRHDVYVQLANWVTRQLAEAPTVLQAPPLAAVSRLAARLPQRPGERYELALALHSHGGQWSHSFSLPHAAHFSRPALVWLPPARVFDAPHSVTGDELFYLLFGSDSTTSGELLGAAFDLPSADPTRYPLRLRLLTADARLGALPWGTLSYRGRRLRDHGWTVELQPPQASGFPEYPPHTCYFPGKVVLIYTGAGPLDALAQAHERDLQSFFQRHWPEAPEPLIVHTAARLQEMLRSGATRLVYVYGSADAAGLLLEGTVVPWAALAALCQRSGAVSAVLVNVRGEAGCEAVPATRVLLDSALAVLVQCHEPGAEAEAARAGLAWLHGVLVASERLDPVRALYQALSGQVTAWTRYASWQTVAPYRVTMPELVNVLLDRRSQRAEMSQAKNDFYTFKTRRIYQAVAFGRQGARVRDFPGMVSQHLRQEKRPQEVFRHHTVTLRRPLRQGQDLQDLDDLARQSYGLAPRQSVLAALLDGDTVSGNDFWFIVLGWLVPQPLQDAERGTEIIHTIATWCRTRLLPDMRQDTRYANVRVLSVVALEVVSADMVEALEDGLVTLTDELNDDESFHCGQLGELDKVKRQDLRNYFQDQQICSCPDPYRREFPDLLLAGRSDMTFDAAVTTIKRGEPDNWGALSEELKGMRARAEWPPAADDVSFWESYDGR